MSDKVRPGGFPTEDWVATPPVVQELVVSLLATVRQLTHRIADLEEKQRKTSRNSSKPPSSDPPNAPARPQRPSSGRKRGRQQGHKGSGRKLNPNEEAAVALAAARALVQEQAARIRDPEMRAGFEAMPLHAGL